MTVLGKSQDIPSHWFWEMYNFCSTKFLEREVNLQDQFSLASLGEYLACRLMVWISQLRIKPSPDPMKLSHVLVGPQSLYLKIQGSHRVGGG